MATIEDMKKKNYTQKGLNALEGRLKTFIGLFNEGNFPFTGQMLGFGQITINDNQECLARIIELSDLIGFQAKLELNNETGKAEIIY